MSKQILGILLMICVITGGISPKSGQAQTPLAVISPENADQLAMIQELGQGLPLNVTWSPDGYTLAVQSSTGVWLHDMRQLDAEPRHLIDPVAARNIYYPISEIFFTADNEYLITRFGTKLAIWEAATGIFLQEVTIPDQYKIPNTVQVHLGGQDLILAYEQGVFQLLSPQAVPPAEVSPSLPAFSQDERFVGGNVTLSPDQQMFLYARDYPTDNVELWDIETESQIVNLSDHDWAGWLPGSSYFWVEGSTAAGYTFSLWESKTQTQIWSHPDACNLLTWSQKNQVAILDCSYHDDIKAVDLATGNVLASIEAYVQQNSALTFSADEQTFMFYAYTGVILWNYVDPEKTRTIPIETDQGAYLQDMAINAAQNWIATTAADNIVRIFDITTATQMAALRYTGIQETLVFTPDSQTLISASADINYTSADNHILIWQLASGQVITELAPAYDVPHSLDVSADGRYLLSTSGCGRAQLWSLETLSHLTDIEDICTNLLFSATPGQVFWVNHQADFHWNALPGAEQAQMSMPTGLVSRSSALSNNGDLWIVDNAIYDIPSEKQVAALPHDLYSVAFSPDDSLFAASEMYAATVSLWNTRTLTQQATWTVHHDATTINGDWAGNFVEVVFSPDGRLLVAAGATHILVIDVATKAVIARLTAPNEIQSLAFSPDGTQIAVGNQVGLIQIWGVVQ